MLIDRMQSVNLKVTKESYNCCTVEIYPDWIIKNDTQEELQLSYLDREFPLDPNSVNCLSIKGFSNSKNNFMRVKIYDPANPHENPHKIAMDSVDIFTLFKAQNNMIAKKGDLRSETCCLCDNPNYKKSSEKSKWREVSAFKCIDFAITIEEEPTFKFTKILKIKYRHLIKN